MERNKSCASHAHLLLIIMILDAKKEEIVSHFLKTTGETIRKKRLQKNISQKELGEWIGVDRTTVAHYENGSSDMPISRLSLISGCCNTPVRDFFPLEKSEELLDTFAQLAGFKGTRYRRRINKPQQSQESHLTAKVYERNGKEFIVPVKRKEVSMKQKYRDCEMPDMGVEAFSDKEFEEYLQSLQKDDYSATRTLEAARQMFLCIGNATNKDTVKNVIADYVIDSMIIEPVIKKYNRDALRAYAYYKKLFLGETAMDDFEEPVDTVYSECDKKTNEDCPYRKRCDERVYEELPRFCDLPDDDDTLV